MKTSDLIGPALDWAAAKAGGGAKDINVFLDGHSRLGMFNYSTDWALGGPIIERERIRIDCPWNPGLFKAECKIDGVTAWTNGPTVLIAAMRCYVAARLGPEVDIPPALF